jgi:hypothetical protein
MATSQVAPQPLAPTASQASALNAVTARTGATPTATPYSATTTAPAASGPVSFDRWNRELSFIREAGGVGETVDRDNRESYDNYATQWNNADAQLRAEMDNQHGFNPGRADVGGATPRPRGGGGGGGGRVGLTAASQAIQNQGTSEIQEVEVGPESQVFQMQDMGDAQATDATAAQVTAHTNASVAVGSAADDVTAQTYTAEQIQNAAGMAAAEGIVSSNAIATTPEGALSGIAGVASRDYQAELDAMAETPEFLESQESFVVAEVDNQPVEAQAALVDLDPQELVSKQITDLTQSLENDVIPVWARPAVDAVNRAMARRGIEASSVARDSMYSAIIQAAMPIAQLNAEAVKNRANQNQANQQQTNIANAEFQQQLKITNLTNKQQAAMQNAALSGNIDIARFTAAQQTALSNSNFAQTMTQTEFGAEQQSIIQNAADLASMDLANLDVRAKLASQNAQAFLQMDMSNLANEQQTRVINQQSEQQALLSNQSANNAALQFNAQSQTQTDQFMANLGAQISQFNASQTNAMNQFNTSETNRISGINAENTTRVNMANAATRSSLSQFNAQLDQQREQWNSANQQAVEQADITWRRQANTINTAAVNAANQQNVQNAFSMTLSEQQFLWQVSRDQASRGFSAGQSELNRQASLYTAAINNEAAGNTTASSQRLMASLGNVFGV